MTEPEEPPARSPEELGRDWKQDMRTKGSRVIKPRDPFQPLPEQPDWKKHERDMAERAGAQLVKGSGNQSKKSKGKPRPADVTGGKGNFLRQGKSAKGKSVTVSEAALRKVVQEATDMGQRPLIELRIEKATFPVPTDWVMLPAVDFQELVESCRPNQSRP